MAERSDKKLARLTAEIDEKKAKLSQIQAQKTAILNRQKSKLATEARKLQTRRKILMGAYLMHWMESDEDIKKQVLAGLDVFLKKQTERDVLALPPFDATDLDTDIPL